MERDHLQPSAGSLPLIVASDHQNRDRSRDRLLKQSAEDAPGAKQQPSRFKSLHRPRSYSASSYTSQPDDETATSGQRQPDLFPDGRGRNSFQPDDGTTYPGRAGYVAVQGASQLWLPFWLSKFVLICFLLLFAALLTALLLVWYSNKQKDGFYVADSTSSYAWTYGPTAVLVIIISLWRMVDYHVKTLTPWAELRNGPVVASKSLLLDYLSPLQLASLLRAMGNGHIAVVATIAGFVILKITTIFSTGLFELNTVPAFDTTFGINTTTKFDSSLASAFNGISALNPSTISNAAVYSFYAHLAHGLPYLPGASDDYVYQTFEAAGNSPTNASITAEIDAFTVEPNCVVLDVRIDGPASIQGLNKTNAFSKSLSLTLPDGKICKHWANVSVPVQDPQHYITPKKQITGTYQGVYCSTNDGGQGDIAKGPDAYLYTITDVRYTQTLFSNASKIDNSTNTIAFVNSTSRAVKQMSNLLCQPNYALTRVNVTNSTVASLNGRPSQIRLVHMAGATNHTLQGFSPRNLSSIFNATVQASDNLFGQAPLNSSGIDSAPQVPNILFSLMAATQNSQDFDIFLDGQRLQSAAEKVFKGVSLEWAQQNLLSSDQTGIVGQAVYPQQRLYMRPTSLWTMTACFAFMVLLTISLLFAAPSAVVSRDPSSIAAHAAILARSTDLNRELRREGTTQERSQRSILSAHSYRASVVASDNGPPVFKIQMQLGGRPESISARNLPIVSWWLPLTLSSPVLLAMAVLPIGAIVGLEFLQQASDSNNGLLTLPADRFSEAYVHYIPALVMLLIATMFNSLDFNIAVFTPFSKLRSGYAKSRRTMTSSLLGKTPPFAVYEALRSLHLGALLSLAAALVASVLTIVVSGLYSVQILTSTGPTRSLDRHDVFNLTWTDSYANDAGAAATLSLVEHLNVSYPDFTYGELAFPSLALGDLENRPDAFSVVAGPATASILAIRANLDCNILEQSAYIVTSARADPHTQYGVDEAFVNATFGLPSGCHLAGYQGNQSTLQYANTFQLVPEGEAIYAGAQLDLVFRNTSGQNYGEDLGQYIPDNPPSCPSLAFTFGSFKLDSTDRSNVTTMVCYQQLQQVSAEVSFLSNSTSIDTTRPPVVDESTVMLLSNPLSSTGSTSFEYRIQNNLFNEFATFNGPGSAAASPDSSSDLTKTIDIFYQAVINGLDKVREEELVGKQNQERFFKATNHFYRKYMAQAINANMRKPCPTTGCPSDLLSRRQASSSAFQATVSVSRPRLVQSATSKLVLQILLGTMLFCGTLAYLLTPVRNVLPCNPCTIAGTMALLAGSKLCWSIDEAVCECCGKPQSHDADSMMHAEGDHHEDRADFIPHGAEWMSNRELRAVFSKQRYTLGWWQRGYGDSNRGEGKRYGIDVGRADGLDDQDWELGKKRTRRYTDEEGNIRRSRIPNWMMGPLKEPEPEPPKQQIAEQLSAHQVRQSRMPEWMLGPLKPDRAQVQEHELNERRPRGVDQDGNLGLAQPDPQRASPRQSRLPHWLLGPLKPDASDEAARGAYARPEEAFASGALRGPDMPGLGPHRP